MYSYKENINNCGYLNVAKNISMEYVFDFIKINISLLTCTLPLIEKKKKENTGSRKLFIKYGVSNGLK